MPATRQPSWLKNSIFYQIYPQSFYDANGDGIGDLPGIIAKLDYVKSLGCDAIWLNPVFESPFRDAGYDVTDFRKVAPRYGTNEDLVRLFDEAHRRGMRVVLDLVAGHTSLEHPWFQESAKEDRNAYSDRYLWVEPVWEPVPPDLSAVRGYGGRNGSFLANFFWCQPALNYGYADPDPAHPWEKPVDHPACQGMLRELRDIMKFWLDRGADGFRVDMAQSLVRGHDEARRTAALRKLWSGIREWFDRDYPDAVLISEWSFPTRAIDAGFHVDFMIHFETITYNSLFRNHRRELITTLPRGESYFTREGSGNIHDFLDGFLEHYRATKGRGYVSIPTGNHDLPPRLAEDRTGDELKCALLFLLMLPGIPFLYYGDEVGMRHGHGLHSKEGGYERTGVRTPMQWDGSRNAGFSTAEPGQLYLPVECDPENRTVAEAERQENSVLHFVRRLIALRKAHEALGSDGAFEPVHAPAHAYPFVFERAADGERFWIAVNPSGATVGVEWNGEPVSAECVLESGARLSTIEGIKKLTVGPAGYGIWKVEAVPEVR